MPDKDEEKKETKDKAVIENEAAARKFLEELSTLGSPTPYISKQEFMMFGNAVNEAFKNLSAAVQRLQEMRFTQVAVTNCMFDTQVITSSKDADKLLKDLVEFYKEMAAVAVATADDDNDVEKSYA